MWPSFVQKRLKRIKTKFMGKHDPRHSTCSHSHGEEVLLGKGKDTHKEKMRRRIKGRLKKKKD